MILRLLQLFRRQDGISLIMAVGVLGVLSLSGATMIQYASSNSRSSELSKDNSSAYSVAEAGMGEMLAILFNKTNNPLNPNLLLEKTSNYDGGSVTWSGVLDQSTSPASWKLTATGKVGNPTGPSASDVQRTLTANVNVTPRNTQPLGNRGWNYILSTGTSDVCDLLLANTVEINSPLYVGGDLCLENLAWISGGPLLVHGQVTLKASIGTSSTPINEAHIKVGCKYRNQHLHPASDGHPFCSSADNVFATLLDQAPETIQFPVAQWDTWYLESSPGPYIRCDTQSGTPPVFDNDGAAPTASNAEKLSKRNRSVAGTFHLTPATSYSCKTAAGEISWDASARKLTTRGTIYIDGNATVNNGLTNSYDGQATIYLSGSLLLKGSRLCSIVSSDGSTCNWAAWNPNDELLVFVAGDKGGGGQTDVNADTSIEIKSAHFQAGIYGAQKINFSTSSGDPQLQGPVLAPKIVIGNSIKTYTWPAMTEAPAGVPGNNVVYGDPQTPHSFSG